MVKVEEAIEQGIEVVGECCYWNQYTSPYEIMGPPISHAMVQLKIWKCMVKTEPRRAFAEIAVSTRKWANMNEKAYFYDKPMTFDDYHGKTVVHGLFTYWVLSSD